MRQPHGGKCRQIGSVWSGRGCNRGVQCLLLSLYGRTRTDGQLEHTTMCFHSFGRASCKGCQEAVANPSCMLAGRQAVHLVAAGSEVGAAARHERERKLLSGAWLGLAHTLRSSVRAARPSAACHAMLIPEVCMHAWGNAAPTHNRCFCALQSGRRVPWVSRCVYKNLVTLHLMYRTQNTCIAALRHRAYLWCSTSEDHVCTTAHNSNSIVFYPYMNTT